jgi:GntR family transcriptional regulator of arabinose operon
MASGMDVEHKRGGGLPKYKRIVVDLRAGIHTGQYRSGGRLPSETDLGEKFGVSRLTVQRALKELQIEGLVERRAGSGTYVRPHKPSAGHMFGLLIPGMGDTEIFAPICQGMAEAGRAAGHTLLWGDMAGSAESGPDRVRQLCADYIDRKVAGVFYAPFEGVAGKDAVNLGICETLKAANTPIVLLDRGIFPYPQSSGFDLVGIDNRRAGYRITQYLIDRGCRRPAFLGRIHAAPTVDDRISGFRDAASANGCEPCRVLRSDATNADAIGDAIRRWNPDGFACANDSTAAELMRTLDALDIKVPDEMRIAGIDDVRYASHLRVPLTTLRQPCKAIGEVAMQTMLARIADPRLPVRDILLDCILVVRRSCGE